MEAGNFREPDVERIAFALPEGGVSDIIETDAGYYIVKARKVYPGKRVSFEQAQEQIEQTLRERQHLRLQTEYFERLQRQAAISTSKRLVQLGVERALARYRRRRHR
jgi:parvulin-like peptidyl-prolyl isomerase